MPEEAIEQPKSKKKLIIIIVAAVAVLLGVGAGAYWFFASDKPAEEDLRGATTELAAPVDPIAYVNIAQPFVFNVAGKQRDRMVQIKAQLMVRGAANEENALYHSPLIESTLLSTFASATVEQLRSSNGRVELRNKATSDIQAALTQVVGQPVIERVLFTDFVIQ
ncbi:flagellar basal body-associated protein FliL [Vibrio hippocampi]|uniref:Flagellar protein FliL n=1 Tax=Vibrio hippocampi TaxID=654686 RepID=A0ABN8DF20_9VIBR|nr:flagellar basal body-associated protein FliL [Vibrio hippocampi]CAH0525184.1 hypothetical protein VHP8226_00843 [Vibrio hippocampi]